MLISIPRSSSLDFNELIFDVKDTTYYGFSDNLNSKSALLEHLLQKLQELS